MKIDLKPFHIDSQTSLSPNFANYVEYESH